MSARSAVALLVLLAVSACSTTSGTKPSAQVGIDGGACVGTTVESVPGLTATTNAALQSQAQLATGKGGTCTAKTFSVTAPVVLYRVFDSSNAHSKFGSWWALTRPTGPKDAYRTAYGICPEWSNLDRMVSCEIRPGSEVVIGTTQSATCADGSVLPKTASNQVFVPNNGKAGITHVGACTDEVVWP
jgi:hypothetical protein